MDIKNQFKEMKRFLWFVIDHFIQDDCTYRASALTFTTLLAIVPLMSVGFSILSTFPVFEDLRGPLQNFIFENFVPATGKVIQEYLQLFAAQVSKLSMIGVIFLFVTALLVMYTIERSMNTIWRVESSRHGVSAFLLYWAILSLAPFLLGLSLAASSYLFSMPLILDYHAPYLFLRATPSLLSLIGFTFLYMVVPNCRVKFWHAFSGAIVATVLFETAKKGFAYYLSQYNTYELLYGAFATIPIFFIWIYWVWLIILIGAEISYAFSAYYKRRPGEPLDGFSHALLWLQCLWQAQIKGESVSLTTLIHACDKPFAVDINHMLNQLTTLNLITTTQGNYILTRDLNQISLYDLAQQLPYRLPNALTLTKDTSPITTRWHDTIHNADETLKQNLSVSLDNLFRSRSNA